MQYKLFFVNSGYSLQNLFRIYVSPCMTTTVTSSRCGQGYLIQYSMAGVFSSSSLSTPTSRLRTHV
jgi:hypothetical protein